MHALRRLAIISAVVGAAALVAAGCGSGSDATTATKKGSSTTATQASGGDAYGGGSPATSSSSSSSSSSSGAVSVADNAKFGKLLVGPNGKTLYLFEKDNGTTSACTGGCATIWPALTASGSPKGGDGVDASKLSTADGQKPNQVVYNGHLLYYYAGDNAPGDVNGVTIPKWYPVNPAGDKIDAS